MSDKPTIESLKKRIQDLEKQLSEYRTSEEKYRILVENANDAIFIMQKGRILFFNQKAGEIGRELGVDLSRNPFIKYIHPEDRTLVLDRHRKRLQGEDLPSNYSFRLINKKEEILWVDLNTVCINWDDQPATLNSLRDITVQKRLEARLLESEKMEALGTIAGGIAHDFNNLLMAIQGNASLMSLDISSDHPHYESLQSIENCVKSGAELTRHLLGFAKEGKYEIKPTDLNELIKRSAEMFGRTRKEVHIHTKFQRDIRAVEIDRGQMTHTLLNMYVNAAQAMPKGGNLNLETKNVDLNESDAVGTDLKPGKYVRIDIDDNGTGMDKETVKRVFEPFFTTKEIGRGTGLGLASAYGIIKNHGGIIRVSSAVGEGSTFTIYLPASEKEIEKEKKVDGTSLKGVGTLLFVDDEEIILNIGVKILKKLGYKVLTAQSGSEAIRKYSANLGKIDMVILDMVMPDMGGNETFDRLKEIDPDVKVLLSSGYSIAGQATEILKRGCRGFIQKPYRLKALSQKVKEILAA